MDHPTILLSPPSTPLLPLQHCRSAASPGVHGPAVNRDLSCSVERSQRRARRVLPTRCAARLPHTAQARPVHLSKGDLDRGAPVSGGYDKPPLFADRCKLRCCCNVDPGLTMAVIVVGFEWRLR